MNQWIFKDATDTAALFATLRDDEFAVGSIAHIAEVTVERLKAGNKVLTMGNGGSACDAQHLTQELVGRYKANRRPLPAICLNVDGGAMTCIGNDFGFNQIFARQVETFALPGDVVIVFTTSGQSPNILEALKMARARGAVTVGLLGRDGGEASGLCDYKLIVPHQESSRIQEVHGFVLHVICEAVDRAFA
ncbi:SIS domain-containing protein [bacterium]|nr:SIS domain-containing protein [bacterium]